MGGVNWPQLWKLVFDIVKPVLGEAMKQVALYLWEVVEAWAKGLVDVGGTKPTSEAKKEMYLTMLGEVAPGLKPDHADLVLETAHKYKTRKGEGGMKPV